MSQDQSQPAVKVRSQRYAQASRRTLYLHIGLPKTASTWLQTKVFPLIDGVIYRDTPRSDLLDGAADRRLMSCIFRRSASIWREYGDEIFAELFGDAGREDSRDALISDEAIGRTASRPEAVASHLDALRTKAKEWGFGRIAVICIVRRQDHWLASHYAQMSSRNPHPSQRDFADLVAKVVSPRRARYQFGMLLDYAALHRRLSDVLDDSELVFFAYEDLARSQHDFTARLLQELRTPPAMIERICANAGARANVRASSGGWSLSPRRLDFMGRGIMTPGWADPFRAKRIQLTPDLSRQLLETYAQSNRDFEAAAKLGLERHGYY